MSEFLKIGEVAQKFKITTRTLRFYEEKGLLVPSKIDENKYRLYSEVQLEDLRKILFLKDLGLELQTIAEYLSADENVKRQILQSYRKKLGLGATMIEKIIKTNDFNLENLDDIVYYGNQVREKKLSSLCGIWLLDGIYTTLKDAQNGGNKLDKFTPYSFLAFDEKGNSPWFYNADKQKISFNTFFTPVSEIYQIKDDKLYLQISNPKQHIFVDDANSVDRPHILVFKLFSKNYEDYKNFLTFDNFDGQLVFDKNLVGCWKLRGMAKSMSDDGVVWTDSNSILLVENDFKATMFESDFSRNLIWTKGHLFDEKAKQQMEYCFKNDLLIVENKNTIYKFTGHVTGYFVYQKIKF